MKKFLKIAIAVLLVAAFAGTLFYLYKSRKRNR